jgi:hypothetical protein
LLFLGNINAARYRQEILQPFLRNCMLMNCSNDTFNGMEKLEEKLKKLITLMLENVINALKMRTLKCSEEEGRHFQHLI